MLPIISAIIFLLKYYRMWDRSWVIHPYTHMARGGRVQYGAIYSGKSLLTSVQPSTMKESHYEDIIDMVKTVECYR